MCTVINADGTLVRESMSPEAINSGSLLAVSEQEPETEDGLGQDVKNSISDDLGIDTPLAGSISNSPDNWVQGPENKCEETNGCEEPGSLVILGGYRTTTWDGEQVDNDKVSSTCHGIVCPLLTIRSSEGCKETEENHQDVGNDGNEDVGSVQACEECKVEKEERCGDGPINVSCPIDLSVDVLGDIRGVLVNMVNDSV